MYSTLKSRVSTVFVTVDGGWTSWSNVTSCSASCGFGQVDQTRSCTNPAPVGIGMPCIGDTNRTVDCDLDPCPNGIGTDLLLYGIRIYVALRMHVYTAVLVKNFNFSTYPFLASQLFLDVNIEISICHDNP